MNAADTYRFAATLDQWHSASHGTWHFVAMPAEVAEALSATALMQRLESGRRSGFGSVKLDIRLGGSAWRTSAFPIGETGWAVPVSAKVRKAEQVGAGDRIEITVSF